MVLCIIWLIFVLHLETCFATEAIKCKEYNIFSSLDSTCEQKCSCMTLSQFIANTSRLITQSTTLLVHPGIHILNVSFHVLAVSYFTIKSVSNEMTSTVIKYADSVSIYLDSVPDVFIGGLTFIGGDFCFADELSSKYVETSNSSAIVVMNSNLTIESTSFQMFGGSQWNLSSMVRNLMKKQHMQVGGMIIVSGSNIWIYNCLFRSNTAQLGGTLYVELNSNLVITGTRFVDNLILCKRNCFGGVIFLAHSNVEMSLCNFSNNILLAKNHSQQQGGVIGSFFGGISVISCIFSANSAKIGGVLHCVHCNDVLILGTSFIHNRAKLFGGVAYIKQSYYVIINDSYFIHNVANLRKGGIFRIEKTHLAMSNSGIHNNSAYDFGGAISCAAKCIVILDNSNFTENKADSSGGALFLVRSEVLIDSCTFTNNAADSGAALFIIYSNFICQGNNTLNSNFANYGAFTSSHSMGIINGSLLFRNNSGSLFVFDSMFEFLGTSVTVISNRQSINVNNTRQGGAITIILSLVKSYSPMLISNNFAFNGGGILAISSSIFIGGINNISNNVAYSSGGGLFLYRSQLMSQGSTNVTHNKAAKRGGGIHSVSSSIILRLVYSQYMKRKPVSYLSFISNAAKMGGGLCMELSSKFFTVYGKSKAITFVNNSADKGGAIFVADGANGGSCESKKKTIRDASDSECFFQPLEIPQQSGSEHLTFSELVEFHNNTARIMGSVLFGGLLDRCTINNEVYSHRNNFVQHILNETASDAVRVCLCQDDTANCSYTSMTYDVRRGEKFSVKAVVVDQVNHTLSANIISYLSHRLSYLYAGQHVQMVNSSCTDLTFQVYSPMKKEKLNLYADGPCRDKGISVLRVEINILPCTCPLGFQPLNSRDSNNSTCECDCDLRLYPYITQCNHSIDSVIRQSDVWVSPLNKTSYLISPHCPFDYCVPPTISVSINLSDANSADAQCATGRTGKLCGMCKRDLSLSLGSSQCPPYWPILFTVITIVAILAGIISVVILLLLKLTVAAGTLNGLIFFANIIDANSSVFIPFHKVNFSTVFIAWLNLDFGFDVCYISGMDAYVKSWLEFAFPSYVIMLVVLLIKFSHHSKVLSRLIKDRNPVATLATLILLSYAKLLQNIITVVSFEILKYPNGTHEVVWRPDASIQYLSGKHIPLFCAAVVVLVCGFGYTVLLFSYQWINQFPDKKLFRWIWNTKLTSFMDAYNAPFRKHYRFWTGVLLFSRAILYITSSVNVSGEPSINLLALVIVIGCLWLLKGDHVYKQWHTDVLESMFYLNILVLCAGKFYVLKIKGHHHDLLYTSIGVSFAMFLYIIFHHMFKCGSLRFGKMLKAVCRVFKQNENKCSHKLLGSYVQFSSEEAIDQLD